MTGSRTKAETTAKQLVARLGFPMRGPRMAMSDDATGLPMDIDAPSMRREVRPVGEAVSALAERLGVHAAAETAEAAMAEAVVAAWREAAGPLADRFSPEKYVGGILYVSGGSSPELFEIRRSKLPAIEKRAKKLAPFAKLRQIRLSPAPPLRQAQRDAD